MQCVVVCRDPLGAKTLHSALASTFDLEFLFADRTAARRLHDVGIPTRVGDPRRVSSYLKCDVTATTCVIIEDNSKRSLRRILQAATDAGTTLI